jgi:hypothetical protein
MNAPRRLSVASLGVPAADSLQARNTLADPGAVPPGRRRTRRKDAWPFER